MSEEMLRKKLEPASVGDSGKPLGSGNPGGSAPNKGGNGTGGLLIIYAKQFSTYNCYKRRSLCAERNQCNKILRNTEKFP